MVIPISNPFSFSVREKVDTLTERLDALVIERTAAMAEIPSIASSVSASVLPGDQQQLQHSSTTPLRKIKSCELIVVRTDLGVLFLILMHFGHVQYMYVVSSHSFIVFSAS